MFAAEIATETDYFVLLDENEESLGHRVDALLEFLDKEDYTLAIGTVDSYGYDDGLNKVHSGAWNYTLRC